MFYSGYVVGQKPKVLDTVDFKAALENMGKGNDC